MKKHTLLVPLLASALPVIAQTTIWDGENQTLGSRGGCWDDGTPTVVVNPNRGGINPSAQCLMFTMTNGSKVVKIPFRDWVKPNMNGSRRLSLLVRKPTNANVKIELSDPTDGSTGYWEKVASWYGGSGEWQRVVFDFSTNLALNDFPGILTLTASTDDVATPENVYIDDVRIEDLPRVNGRPLSTVADASLSGQLSLTGSWMKGDCQNVDGSWVKVDYNDFERLLPKLTAQVTSIDLREATTKDAYNAFGNVNPNILVYADHDFGDFNVVANGATSQLVLNENYSFHAPEGFTADAVTLSRNLSSAQNAMCLPFAVTAKELSASSLGLYKGYTVTNGTADVTFLQTMEVAANTPFITNGAATAETIALTNKQVEATPQSLGDVFAGQYTTDSGEGFWGLGEPSWDATQYIPLADSTAQETYFRPDNAFVGDPMPFFDPVGRDFKILYLYDQRPNPTGTYHPIWGVRTTDAANYTSMGQLIPCGSIDSQDAALGTGCVVYSPNDQLYYAFYTGNRYNPTATQAPQAVVMATSKDFKTWTKNTSFVLRPEDYGYGRYDFRDPSVFLGDDGIYHMLITSRLGDKGFLAEFTSSDLQHWTSQGKFMDMMWDRSYECPDVFKMGQWWYLIYSEQMASIRRVQYFKAQSLDGLKACTVANAGLWPDDHEGYLDSRAFYAAKTASDGTNRYIWGWCPTRANNDNTAVSDTETPEWGGNLVASRLIQHADGTLTLGEVPGISSKYAKPATIKVEDQSATGVAAQTDGYAMTGDSYVLFGRLGSHNKISFTVTTNGNTDKFGISLVRSSDKGTYYSLVVNPESDSRRKINLEEEGSEGRGFIAGADSYIFNRPADNIYHVTLYTDNSVCVVYINDTVAYTSRLYGINKNCWSMNNYGGAITISNIKINQF